MKRSEMLKLIESAIDNACGNDGTQRLYPSDEYLAFAVLKAVEKAGMLPPPRWLKGVCSITGEPIRVCRQHTWEPED